MHASRMGRGGTSRMKQREREWLLLRNKQQSPLTKGLSLARLADQQAQGCPLFSAPSTGIPSVHHTPGILTRVLGIKLRYLYLERQAIYPPNHQFSLLLTVNSSYTVNLHNGSQSGWFHSPMSTGKNGKHFWSTWSHDIRDGVNMLQGTV